MKRLFFIFFSLSFNLVIAQQRVDTKYLSRDGAQVNQVDSAYVMRKITKSADGNTVYMEDYYLANGKLARKMAMERAIFDYSFDRTFGQLNDIPNFNYHLLRLYHQADSTGTVQVEDGKGFLVETVKYLGENFTEEGNYVGGQKTGIWKGKNVSGTKFFEEIYDQGKLKRGFTTLNGVTTKYTSLFTAPDYKYTNNHIAHLYLEDIGFYRKYAPSHRKRDTRGDWILVTLVIDENGEVAEVHFDQPIGHQNLENDLRKTLLNMPKWKPAKLRGINVRAKYTCAIPSFKAML